MNDDIELPQTRKDNGDLVAHGPAAQLKQLHCPWRGLNSRHQLCQRDYLQNKSTPAFSRVERYKRKTLVMQ
uniref:Uncharacterized protein n=1 Tax=Timema douglasi TaxID=61478 RepID=A0A7R8VC64_TIMDO|nr:unnamed protein product [Timema douglasi]